MCVRNQNGIRVPHFIHSMHLISLSLSLCVCAKYIVLQVWFHIYWTWSIYIACKFVYYVQQYHNTILVNWKLLIFVLYEDGGAIMILRWILSLFRSSSSYSQRCEHTKKCWKKSHALWILLRAVWPSLKFSSNIQFESILLVGGSTRRCWYFQTYTHTHIHAE